VAERISLAVALDGTGWHPGSWRDPDARPADLTTPRYWADLVTAADDGHLDFVTIEDGLGPQSDDPRRVGVRLDAVLIASRVAPLTRGVGLVPTVVVTHTEPFHASKAIATLDYVSTGRAGVRLQVAAGPDVARHFGRREVVAADLMGEAADYAEVLRRLWDSWEDDAEIRDAATGRFVDRNKLHYIDFEGPHFSVRGPSITPRPPQGQPVIAALGHVPAAFELIASRADIGFITPSGPAETAPLLETITPAQAFVDLVVFLAPSEQQARARKERLDELAGSEFRSDAASFVGTPEHLAHLLEEWAAVGVGGFRLRPATLPHDLHRITGDLVPELRRRGRFRDGYEETTLRQRLGLPRPANRYASA
jgi:alkanesulfonate monooxygenase SsuD/methylene tetrahydromethanopterin reductase-like flavin-dependent oxidoreductase (luciferase family)